MADLKSFTSIDAQPIVYCRASRVWSASANRWMTWRQVGYEDLFEFPPQYPVQRYARFWDQKIVRRNGLTYTRFRERLAQIASEVLSRIEGVIVVHDFSSLQRIVERLDQCLVVPVDDDDWLDPNIGKRLAGLTLKSGTRIVSWPNVVWWCDFDAANRLRDRVCVQKMEQFPKMVGSNSYAITGKAFREWPLDQLKTALHKHWQLSVTAAETQRVTDQLSLEVKHVGSTSVLLKESGKDYWWTEEDPNYKPPLWVREHCDKVRELHIQLRDDMGGAFDHLRLIQETKTGN